MDRAVVEMTGVVKRYGKRVALDGLDLTIDRGQVFGLVGSNGAGKTTALSIIAAMTRPTEGFVDVLGMGSFDPSVSAGRMAFMPQDTRLPSHVRVYEQLLFYACLQGMRGGEAKAAVSSALERVHLTDRAGSKVGALSHGMRRRMIIGQAFLGNPELILLDEPLSGLDPREVVNIRNILASRKMSDTVVISSHNLAEIERVCDFVAFIEKGRLVKQDSMDRVTGRGQTLWYMLESGDVPVGAMEKAWPGVRFDISRDEVLLKQTGCKSLLRCDFGRASPGEINAVVLRILLDAGVGIIGVRRGSDLEQAYLDATE